MLSVNPSKTWFIGDSCERDVLGAAAARNDPFWLNPNGRTAGPGPRFRSVKSLEEFRQQIEFA
jgi:FMN phosphatase YigB (HAD superfamily)